MEYFCCIREKSYFYSGGHSHEKDPRPYDGYRSTNTEPNRANEMNWRKRTSPALENNRNWRGKNSDCKKSNNSDSSCAGRANRSRDWRDKTDRKTEPARDLEGIVQANKQSLNSEGPAIYSNDPDKQIETKQLAPQHPSDFDGTIECMSGFDYDEYHKEVGSNSVNTEATEYNISGGGGVKVPPKCLKCGVSVKVHQGPHGETCRNVVVSDRTHNTINLRMPSDMITKEPTGARLTNKPGPPHVHDFKATELGSLRKEPEQQKFTAAFEGTEAEQRSHPKVCDSSTLLQDSRVRPPQVVTHRPASKHVEQKCTPPKPSIASATANSDHYSKKLRQEDDERVSQTVCLMNPRPKNSDDLRYIILDGSNIAMTYGGGVFSGIGILLVVNFFHDRGHTDIKVIVPQWRKHSTGQTISNHNLLKELDDKGILVWGFNSRRLGTRKICYYDDLLILELANKTNGIVVTNDAYNDVYEKYHQYKTVIERNILPFRFVDNFVMVPNDPLGRWGPTLDEYLSKSTDLSSYDIAYT